MTTSRKARQASAVNYVKDDDKKTKAYLSEVKAIRAKYEDRGSSGEKQMLKELAVVDSKFNKDQRKRFNKGAQDDDNIIRYGKDAMKGKSFAKYNNGGMTKKKMGYSKGGMCGASNPAARPVKKANT